MKSCGICLFPSNLFHSLQYSRCYWYKCQGFIFLWLSTIHCIYTCIYTTLLYPLIRTYVFSMSWLLSINHYEHGGEGIFERYCFHILSKPRSGVAGLYSSSILYFLRNLHPHFHSYCTNLHSHQQCMRVPFSLHSCQRWLHIVFLKKAILTDVKPVKSLKKSTPNIHW